VSERASAKTDIDATRLEVADSVLTDINVRAVSGAAHLEEIAGYTGDGVIGIVRDGGLDPSHPEFASNPPTIESNTPFAPGSPRYITKAGHGTKVWGLLFADGLNEGYRGVLPDADGIFVQEFTVSGGNLYEFARDNRAVFVSSSWGTSESLPNYLNGPQYEDERLFNSDVVLVQAYGNAGLWQQDYEQKRRAIKQGVAKNALSVGGIRHFGNDDVSDDRWENSGSIGPTEDGRIKPDLSFYFDGVNTTALDGEYSTFGGTSAAAPQVAGYIGLLFEMWADGVFRPDEQGINNPTTGLDRDVFDSRPHAATMRALAVNTAYDYPFTGTGQNVPNTRAHQGWGRIDVREAYERSLSGNMPLIVDETAVVAEGDEPKRYVVSTTGGADCTFRATMVYSDPAGENGAEIALVNDLSLRVTAPDGTSYWGNNGLWSGNWSTPGGTSNTVDTVENVFVDNAAAGNWTVEVVPTNINQDAHLETTTIDADFGLVVSGSCMESAAPAHTPADATRLERVTDLINAFESYGVANGTYETASGSQSRGFGSVYVNQSNASAYSTRSIAETLHDAGVSVETSVPSVGRWEIAARLCKDRVAVFSKADNIVTDPVDDQWWRDNDCPRWYLEEGGRSYFQLSALLTTERDAIRLDTVADLVTAFETYGDTQGTYAMTTGYLNEGRGSVYVNESMSSNYSVRSLTEALNDAGVAIGTTAPASLSNKWEIAAQPCNGRVAIFSKGDNITTDPVDDQWWADNNCSRWYLNQGGRSYFKLTRIIGD